MGQLPHWQYERIKEIASAILCTYSKNVPVDIFALARLLNIALVPYSTLTKNEIAQFTNTFRILTENGFLAWASGTSFQAYIYYNDMQTEGRIRFTLAHEIGHFVLGHKQQSELAEREVNFFAKYLLANPIEIELLHLKNPLEIQTRLKLSNAFAHHAFMYYQKWKKIHAQQKKFTNYEFNIINHFTKYEMKQEKQIPYTEALYGWTW